MVIGFWVAIRVREGVVTGSETPQAVSLYTDVVDVEMTVVI